MQRRLEPEWLDTLAPADPRAVESRGDLRRLNAWMRNAVIMARVVRRFSASPPPRRLVEVGAGDGAFMLSLARQLARNLGQVEVVLVDRLNVLAIETVRQIRGLGWRVETVQAEVFDWLARFREAPLDLMIANLFLHHFRDDDLRRLLAVVAQTTRAFVACEPRRTPMALVMAHGVGLIGCNAVTRHDARVSVRAGFRGTELSALWPERQGWHLREGPAGPFSHCFYAQRRKDRD